MVIFCYLNTYYLIFTSVFISLLVYTSIKSFIIHFVISSVTLCPLHLLFSYLLHFIPFMVCISICECVCVCLYMCLIYMYHVRCIWVCTLVCSHAIYLPIYIFSLSHSVFSMCMCVLCLMYKGLYITLYVPMSINLFENHTVNRICPNMDFMKEKCDANNC